jgi:fibro-slime domain-containing protein
MGSNNGSEMPVFQALKTAVFVLWLSFFVFGQTAIWKVPVTFYDFHSDGSCPEFEGKLKGGPDSITIPTVVDTLSALRTPMKNPALGITDSSGSWCIDYIDRWYRDWAPGDSIQVNRAADTIIQNCRPDSSRVDTLILDPDTIFQYSFRRCDTVRTPAITYTTDTAFKNIRIDDTLELQVRSTDTGLVSGYYGWLFFPLEGKGYGAELGASNPANYSFTTHIHNRIQFAAGATISLNSDDDSWLFINNHLAIDNGGPHGSRTKGLVLDSLHLAPDTIYNFDLFSAERHTGGSVLVLSMNNVEMVDKRVNVAEGYSRPIAGQSKDIILGASRIAVPEATAKIDVVMVDLHGRTLAELLIPVVNVSLDIGKRIPGGVIIARIRCLDRNNHPLGTVAARLVKGRR